MSLESKLITLAQAVGTDVKTLTSKQGDLTSLSTTTKSNLVAAINELYGLIGSAGASIDDLAGDGATSVTWSADKIFDTIEAAKLAVKNDLINGAGAALDTLNELAAALGNDPNFAATIAAEVANRVRFDAAQTLSGAQQTQARANIDAASGTEFANLVAGLGNYDRDFAADYTAAKA
jgi:hypothetical protein